MVAAMVRSWSDARSAVRSLARGVTVALLWSCAARSGGPSTPEPVGPQASATFQESTDEFANPERGLLQYVDVLDPGDIDYVHGLGVTLANVRIRLDAYRGGAIDAAFLADLSEGLANVRAAGLKVVLRFQYNDGSSDDAPRSRVLGHIDQLTPLLRANADVIAVVQAGFIGAWGEWHSSSNGLDNPADRSAIAHALLDALPPSRMIQVRRPDFKTALAPGGPVDDAHAFTAALPARIGHHNDCFLGSDSDQGTYADPIEQEKQYVADDSRFTPVGGEGCQVNAPRTGCATAVAELARLHWTFINRSWPADMLAGWRTEGCFDEIRRNLGYRFVLREARWTEAAVPGGVIDLDLTISNVGYAAPFNERPVYAVIGEGSAATAVRLDSVDARRWPAGETTAVSARLVIPATVRPGVHRLALWLPDPAETLKDRPAYAIQLASTGVWVPVDGVNVITRALKIDPPPP